ncbi:MAG: hypothetical protein FWH21_00850 [Kiritimatiellaeota bacterium]|nr:hypothetical protein [Kiritimatiellota bacterium]
MKQRKSKSVHYANGQYRPSRNGGFDCAITVKGVRHRSRQPDERAARVWLDAAEADATRRAPLTRAQMLDAQDALARLPRGMTLSSVVDKHLSREAMEPVPTVEAVERFLDNRRRRVKPVTLSGYRHSLGKMAEGFPEMIADVTARHVDTFISRYRGASHNSMLTCAKVFFNFAVAEGWMPASPAGRIGRVRTPEPPKGILTVEEASAILAQAEIDNPKLIPYLALGMFAGIRPSELQRLTSDALRDEYVMLQGSETKTYNHRTITIRPNLSRWLDAYPFEGWVAYQRSASRQHKAVLSVRMAAGVANWPKDCMRHSFATYAYDLERNAASVASEMGHQGTGLFFRHYRALVSRGEGERFFSISPKQHQNCQRIVNEV